MDVSPVSSRLPNFVQEGGRRKRTERWPGSTKSKKCAQFSTYRGGICGGRRLSWSWPRHPTLLPGHGLANWLANGDELLAEANGWCAASKIIREVGQWECTWRHCLCWA